jgi:glutaredoxin-like protein NrdH
VAMTRVAGEKRGELLVYTLSTCGWCRRVKRFLDELGVEYCYVEVDNEKGAERETTSRELKKWNPRLSFPTIVINGEQCIIGFKEDEIRKALNL